MARSYSHVSKNNKIGRNKETYHLQQVSGTENLNKRHISEIELVHALFKYISVIKWEIVNITGHIQTRHICIALIITILCHSHLKYVQLVFTLVTNYLLSYQPC